LTQQGLENPYDKFRGQLTPFMCACSKLIESGDVSFYSYSTSEVAQRALRESTETQMVKGKMALLPRLYKPRSNDVVFIVFLVS
jgi:hypothetical protein